jgi:hypothetical protein
LLEPSDTRTLLLDKDEYRYFEGTCSSIDFMTSTVIVELTYTANSMFAFVSSKTSNPSQLRNELALAVDSTSTVAVGTHTRAAGEDLFLAVRGSLAGNDNQANLVYYNSLFETFDVTYK